MTRRVMDHIKALLHRIFSLCARDVDIASEPGPVLVIAPHPDDESLGCGAIIARLRAKGQKVKIVIVTDGAASGHSKLVTPKEIAATRRAEAENAVQALGVPREDIAFLDFSDGSATSQIVAIEAALGRQIRELAPLRIFSPYGSDRHADHRAVASAVDRLCRADVITCPVYEYPIWFWSWRAFCHLAQPQKLICLRRIGAGEFLAHKKAAITAHRSQFEAPTGEAGWFTFPSGFVELFLTPYELFFEKPRVKH